MAKTSELETKMSEVFVDKAPKLPAGGVKAITEWAPWLALIAGVLSLWSAWALWHWAHLASNVLNYAHDLCNSTYGAYAANSCAAVDDASRLSLWVWLSLIVLAVEGVLYLLAYPGLKARNKQGWNYLFYGALVNVVYAVVSLFTDYNGGSHFIGALIGSVIGFWILFQIRSAYTGKSAAPKAPTA
jgi:hypothetical protein